MASYNPSGKSKVYRWVKPLDHKGQRPTVSKLALGRRDKEMRQTVITNQAPIPKLDLYSQDVIPNGARDM